MYEAHKLVRSTDPDTSKMAAEEILDRVTDLQDKVLLYAWFRGSLGFTDEDMNEHFAARSSTYRTRRAELTAKGKIIDSGLRRTLQSGRKGIVWRIAT